MRKAASSSHTPAATAAEEETPARAGQVANRRRSASGMPPLVKKPALRRSRGAPDSFSQKPGASSRPPPVSPVLAISAVRASVPAPDARSVAATKKDSDILPIGAVKFKGHNNFLPEVREFITRHTAYNKHDTGWAEGAPSEDHTTPALPHRPPGGPLAAVGLLGGRPQAPARFGGG